MEDVFNPQSLTIKKLLTDSDSLYQIPRYQRPYSWRNDQLERLWEDLTEAFEESEYYFLGSIITAKPEGGGDYLDIVDGQQRLTTLQILICVYRDLFPNINASSDDTKAVDINILKTAIKYNDKFQRLRLMTHSHHESDFFDLIIDEGKSINHKKPTKKSINIEEEPRFRFINTALFFKEKLEDLGEESSGNLLTYLFNKVKVIRIDCHSVSFAIKLFQVLNDRGLDLSNSDLIKSFLIGQIQKIYQSDPGLRKQKEDQFMDDWKKCEQIAIDTEESLNDLFVLYEYYLLAENPKKSLSDELIKKFENLDPNHTIKDFLKFIKLYKEHVYLREDELMYSFWYLRWSMYWRSIVLTALKVEYAQYDLFLPIFRRFYYLNWIAGFTLTKIKQISFNLISWIQEGKPLSFIQQKLEEHLEKNGVIKKAIDNLSGEIYFESWCKPLFYLLEYNQLDTPSYLPIGEKSIQLEHILPQAYKEKAGWSEYHESEEVENWINTGGNLTLLSGSKNIDAKNHPFKDKIESYDGTGYYKGSDKKITSFRITQRIVNDYNSNKFNKKWSPEAITDRWKWFCGQIEDVLEINLSELNKKKFEG